MTHTELTLRIINGLAWTLGPAMYWRRQVHKQEARQALRQWLDTVIRGNA